MRIKNGEDFLRLAVESHLPYYDEIIACYNGCTDNTESLLLALQRQYPTKIKVYHLHPPYGSEHDKTPTDSVHALANYYNYALSKTTYSVVTKLDDDHLAIDQNIAPVVQQIRADIARGIKKFTPFRV